MKTTTLSGRYNLGVIIYLDGEGNQVGRTARRAMTEEQVASLQQLRCIEQHRASDPRVATADGSEGSVGLGETSTFEIL